MTAETPPPLPPPGWYPEPQGSSQRYWDGARWTDQRMPVKPVRKPVPWWLVTILSLIGVIVAAFILDAILSGGHERHAGMNGTTIAASPASDDRGLYGIYPPQCDQQCYRAAP